MNDVTFLRLEVIRDKYYALMTTIKNINLAFRHSENRNKLMNNGLTCHCHQCQTQVIDFTSSLSQELNKALRKSKKPVYGILKRSPLIDPFIKYAAATFIATTSIVAQVHGQVPIKIDSVEHAHKRIQEYDSIEIFGIITEKQPEPIGGYAQFYEAISRELKYPEGLNKSGKVYIQYTVDTLGRMTDIMVAKGLHELADQEALRVIRKLDYSFKPGEIHGKKIKTRMIIPLSFSSHP